MIIKLAQMLLIIMKKTIYFYLKLILISTSHLLRYLRNAIIKFCIPIDTNILLSGNFVLRVILLLVFQIIKKKFLY